MAGRRQAKEGDKQRAYELLGEGLTQKRVAEILGYDVSSIARWSKQGGWHDRLSDRHMRLVNVEEIAIELYENQLMALKQQVTAVKESGAVAKLISKGDVDALLKMSQAARPHVVARADVIQFANRFMAYLSDKDLKIAKQVGPYMNDFVDEACGTSEI